MSAKLMEIICSDFNKKMPANQKLVLAEMFRHCDKDSLILVSFRVLSKATDLNLRHLSSVIKILEKKDIIGKVYRGSGKVPNIYKINFFILDMMTG